MSIVRNIAGVAKGMSITFGEMFKPTEVENYPDGPGPNRGAHFQDRFRGAHCGRTMQADAPANQDRRRLPLQSLLQQDERRFFADQSPRLMAFHHQSIMAGQRS